MSLTIHSTLYVIEMSALRPARCWEPSEDQQRVCEVCFEEVWDFPEQSFFISYHDYGIAPAV